MEVVDSAKTGKMYSPEKNLIGTPRSARIHQLRLNKTPTSSPNKSLLATPQSRPGTPSNGTPSRKRQRESSPSSDRKNEKRRRIDISDFNFEQLVCTFIFWSLRFRLMLLAYVHAHCHPIFFTHV